MFHFGHTPDHGQQELIRPMINGLKDLGFSTLAVSVDAGDHPHIDTALDVADIGERIPIDLCVKARLAAFFAAGFRDQ